MCTSLSNLYQSLDDTALLNNPPNNSNITFVMDMGGGIQMILSGAEHFSANYRPL
jgi:hypothetical protein